MTYAFSPAQSGQSPYTFFEGNPVPDGMPFSTISLDNHPSNIAVFEAEDTLDALAQAQRAMRHGLQGAVWLAKHDFSFVRGHDIFEKIDRDDRTELYVREQESLLRTKFYAVTCNVRTENASQFIPHLDGNYPATYHYFDTEIAYPGRHISSVAKMRPALRVLFNFDGVGTVLFARNIILAEMLAHKKLPHDITLYGHAYICPKSSVTFLMQQDEGLLLYNPHSSPEVPATANESYVRQLAVLDCFTGP